jgi:hypothetical protein
MAAIVVAAPHLLWSQANTTDAAKRDNALKQFLQEYVGSSQLERTTRYSEAYADLNGDGNAEVIVYLTGPWCGTSGCTMLVLAPKGDSYQLVTKVTISRRPIRVLSSTSNGWHDIGVWVQGGGIQPGFEARLQFDGRSYPGNPSVEPARRTSGHLKGDIVLSGAELETPLFP